MAVDIEPKKAVELDDELGKFLLGNGQYAQAAAVYRKTLDRRGVEGLERANVLFRLSMALEFAGDTDAALAAIDNALKLAPQEPLLFYQQGWVHFHAKHWQQAEDRLRETLDRFPQDAESVRRVRLLLSALYVAQGDKSRGERVLEEVYETDPDDPGINNDLGYLYAEAGKKLDQAEAMIRKALATEPDNAAYLDSLGWVLYRQGKFAEAAEHLQKAVSLPGGDDSTPWNHLGDSLAALKKPAEARRAWTKALELARGEAKPDAEEIEKIEAKLKSLR